MSGRTSNVTVRVEPEIKEQAESIMEKMGISASTAINMFYRQIIYSNGMPFRPCIPTAAPKAYDEMTKAEFDAAMEESIAQSEAGQAVPFDEAFERIMRNITNE